MGAAFYALLVMPVFAAKPKKFFITSPKDEAQMGAAAFQQISSQLPVHNDPKVNEQVKRVATRLLNAIPADERLTDNWEIVVFDHAEPNAFALPGGKIGVHTAILPICQNDAGLATVLGHEIAHVTERHAGERFREQFFINMGYAAFGLALSNEDYKTRQLWMTTAGVGSTMFLTLPFSRKHELQADRRGLEYMARAGYDPREAPLFWERMRAYVRKKGGKPPEFLSTHPADETRIKKLRELLPAAMELYQTPKP
jgi:predicted Zn-dependent protease